METQFPQFGHYWRNEHVYGEVEAFDIGAIEDWFKRCMGEFPVDTYVPTDKEHVVRIVTPEYEEVESWFEKWFSQFIEKGEDENV